MAHSSARAEPKPQSAARDDEAETKSEDRDRTLEDHLRSRRISARESARIRDVLHVPLPHMSESRKHEQTVIEAVAKHFSATWEQGGDTFDGYFWIAGKRIAVEVTTVKQRIGDRTDLPKPRLRFDRVARGLITRLQIALRESVPDGTTVILTISAPIRLPSKTAEALEDIIRVCLARRPTQVQCKDTIHGNQIRIRLVKSNSRHTSKVIGLVHNPDSDPDMLLGMAQSLLQHVGAAADRRTSPRSKSERWLIVITKGGVSHVETYRQVYAQLSVPTDFTKILMVFSGDRVETLMG